jgi:hypothetical protein
MPFGGGEQFSNRRGHSIKPTSDEVYLQIFDKRNAKDNMGRNYNGV